MSAQGFQSVNRHPSSRSTLVLIDTEGGLPTDPTSTTPITVTVTDQASNAWTGKVLKVNAKQTRLKLRLTAPTTFRPITGTEPDSGSLTITLTQGTTTTPVDPIQVNYVNDNGM